MFEYTGQRLLAEIDWQEWKPRDTATLLFVRRDDQILLIEKKRGLGAGLINGPGGRLEPGETPLQAAIREVQEELCVTPTGIEFAGELKFQFTDGYSIHGHVFTATDCIGEARETDEAVPLWTSVEKIPYDRMWADDRLWVPLMLSGTPFYGRFIFDAETMLDYTIQKNRP